MSWKKNVFSYLTWIVYTLITGTALVSLGSTFFVEAGFAAWWGILASPMFMGMAGGVTFLLYKGAGARRAFADRNRKALLAVEFILVAGFLALGCFLRVQNMAEAEEASVYFEMAEVVSGQGVPQMVHGAVYFYVRLLHTLFLLLGNQYAAGIWLQICLQLTALLVLYFVIRKISGAVSGIIVFGFCMCAPYMRQSALVLSPGMLYFLFLGIAAWLTVEICGSRLRFPAFAFVGVLAALCCYIDISGGLLLLLAVALAFSEQAGGTSQKKRLAAAGICVLAAVLGFLFFIWADAFMSGKDFWRVAGAWLDLYRPGGFWLPYTIDTISSGGENFGLFGLMAFGVFSFWCDERREYHSVYVVAVCAILLASCFGIYTEEMPGGFSLYLMFAVLAGVGLKPCICSDALPETLSGFAGEAAEEPCPDGERRLKAQMQQEEESWQDAQMGQKEESRQDAQMQREEENWQDAQMQREKGSRQDAQMQREEENWQDAQMQREKGSRQDAQMQREEENWQDAQTGQEEESRQDAQMQQEEMNWSRAQMQQEEEHWPDMQMQQEKEDWQDAQMQRDKESREREEPAEGAAKEGKKVRYLDNPLPLPKKHVKRVMDYSIDVSRDDDFDYPVKENDDFDV